MNQPPSDPGNPSGPPPGGGGPFGPPPGGGGPFGPPPGGGFGGPPGGGYGGPPGGGFGGPPGGFGGPPDGGFGGPPGGYGGPQGGGFGQAPFAPPGGGFHGPAGFRPLAPPPQSSGSVGLIVGIVAGVFALFAMVGVGLYIFTSRKHPPPSSVAADPLYGGSAYGDDGAWSDSDASVPVSSLDPMWGARTAPVTLVVFEDFQCPFCARFESTLVTVRSKYGPSGVRVIWKNYPLPFHKDARPAAIAAEAVFRLGGSKAFWKFHDAAYAGQQELNQVNFERWASEAGVDVGRFRSLQDDASVAAKVDADAALAKTVGAQGTPNTFVNGFLITGAQPLDKVTSIVDSEMASATRAIAAGTPSDRIYAQLSQENKTKNPPAKSAAADPPEDENKVYTVPAGKSPARGGPESAKVTIVEFADFQCPFCARAESTLSQLRETYGAKVRFVWKDKPLPFHKDAEPAAELALEARAQKGDAGFWAAHDLLYKNQKALSEEDLESYAAGLHLDAARVKSAIATHRYKIAIDEDSKLADQVGASGTPTFFINGHKLVGAQPIEKFKAIIDRELAR